MGVKYIFFILFNVWVSFAQPSEISPPVNEIHLIENDTLMINCTGYRHGVNIELFTNKTVYGDSGWYGCVDADDLKNFKIANDTAITPYNYNNSEAKWIYVFVKSNTNHFVGSWDLFETIRVKTGDDILIPCRPTSPHFEIKLTKDAQEIRLNERINFDPKRGFVIKNVGLRDSGFYQCISEEDEDQELSYYVFITRKQH